MVDAIDDRGGGGNGDSRGGIKAGGGGVRGLDWCLNDGGQELQGDEMRWGAVETGFGSAGARKGVELTGGPNMAVTWERESIVDGLRKLEKEAPFGKYSKAAHAESAERVHGGLWGEVGRHGRGWARWAKIWEELFLNKIWIFEYTKALEICTRRFRRNFDMRIFF
jgi:hypothetical protein